MTQHTYTNKQVKTTTVNGVRVNASKLIQMFSGNEMNQGGNILVDDSTELQIDCDRVTLRSICGEFTMIAR